MTEFITKEKYTYEQKSLVDGLTGLTRMVSELKDENRELSQRVAHLEQFAPDQPAPKLKPIPRTYKFDKLTDDGKMIYTKT